MSLDEVTESCGTHVCWEMHNAGKINIMLECGNGLSKLYISVKELSYTPFPVSLVLQHEWLSSILLPCDFVSIRIFHYQHMNM